MPRDYKHRIHSTYRPRPYKRRGGKLGVVVFAILALAGAGAIGLKVFSPKPPVQDNLEPVPLPSPAKPHGKPPDTTGKAQPAPAAGVVPPRPVEPRFSFYKILPEKEVIIPDSEIRTMRREEDQGKKPATGQFLIQAGSFTNLQDAEKLRTGLAEIKIKAKLELIKLDNASWYRVKIGPYATLADADRVRQYLRANKIDSVLQKATK